MKLSINLPYFPGFYGSALEIDFEISDDLESYGDCTQEDYDNIDWNAVHEQAAERYFELFWEQNGQDIKDAGVSSMKFVKVDSPRYYNFKNDELVCEVVFDRRKFQRAMRTLIYDKFFG